jgi:hypothetical protein
MIREADPEQGKAIVANKTFEERGHAATRGISGQGSLTPAGRAILEDVGRRRGCSPCGAALPRAASPRRRYEDSWEDNRSRPTATPSSRWHYLTGVAGEVSHDVFCVPADAAAEF